MTVYAAEISHQGLSIDGFKRKQRRCCTCSIAPEGYKNMQSEFIHFEDVLWIEAKEESIYELTYIKHHDHENKVFSPSKVQFTVSIGVDIVETVLSRAYKDTKRQKRLLVLINPLSGQGNGVRIYKKHGAPFFAAARCTTHVIQTTHRFHAQEIVKNADLTQYDAIVCCSGDGLPHEVLNGLAQRPNSQEDLLQMPVCQFPCGSGNSMAMSLYGNGSPSAAAVSIIRGVPMIVDLMRLNQGEKTSLSFLSQTYGIIADADLGTENIRWMGGARFAVGAVVRALAGTSYACRLSVKYAHDNKADIQKHFNEQRKGISESLKDIPGNSQTLLSNLKFGTVNDPVPYDWVTTDLPNLAFFYAGKMPWMATDAFVFPASLPTDGYMDLITWDTSVGRVKFLQLLLQIEHGKHFHSKSANYGKIVAYRLEPLISSGHLSVDGEKFPFKPFQVDVCPRAACLLSSNGTYANVNKDL